MREHYISLDIETSGPIPGEFSMLSLGASVVDDDDKTFLVQLKPLNGNAQKFLLLPQSEWRRVSS